MCEELQQRYLSPKQCRYLQLQRGEDLGGYGATQKHTYKSKQANQREVRHKKGRGDVSDSSVSQVQESEGLKITLANKRHHMEHVQNKGGDLRRVCR